MKILILQLARLGDIYQSWPTLRALHRLHPQAQLTIVSRSKFQAAWEGLDIPVQILPFETQKIFEPLFQNRPEVLESHTRLKKWVDELRSQSFDWVINLSFSAVSSRLTHLIAGGSPCRVTGYSRTSDGYLAIPDDMSAYFHAQVGPGRFNRFHLAEIFATLAEADLLPEDWSYRPRTQLTQTPQRILIHIGASQSHKSVSSEKWVSILSHFRSICQIPVALIGGKEDLASSEKILASCPTGSVVSWVGKTSLRELLDLMSQAQLVVGADSVAVQMASLTKTRTLNLSLGPVQFWETGPRAAQSAILRAPRQEDLLSDRVARVLAQMIQGTSLETGVIQVKAGTPSYVGLFSRDNDFCWELIQALYQGQAFPVPHRPEFRQALEQLRSANQLILDLLSEIEKGAPLEHKAVFLERGEDILEAVAQIVPLWAPVVRWYRTEKIRIGPGTPAEVLQRTQEIQTKLQTILDLYQEMLQDSNSLQEGVR